MHELTWQKSTYSAEAANCVYVATATPSTLYLRESDEPNAILVTTRPCLRGLIRSLKADPSTRSA